MNLENYRFTPQITLGTEGNKEEETEEKSLVWGIFNIFLGNNSRIFF